MASVSASFVLDNVDYTWCWFVELVITYQILRGIRLGISINIFGGRQRNDTITVSTVFEFFLLDVILINIVKRN